MKLSEKIQYCRKKSGQSQEALAEKLGVSRQAVSKWETGESEPEISKLKLLSQVLGVSSDWLLSDEDPEPEVQPQTQQKAQPAPSTDWIESLPGMLGRMVKKYGWLSGLYLMLQGCGIALVGGIARFSVRKMQMNFTAALGMDMLTHNLLSHNPVYLFGGVLLVLGLVVIAAGAFLAIVLKRKFK